MRNLELSAALPADAAEAWEVFIDTASWPSWGRLVVAAEGEFVPGHLWHMELRGDDGQSPRSMFPRFVSMIPGRQVVFETRIGGLWAVRMRHAFDIDPDGPDRSHLRQSFEVTGLFMAPLWPVLYRGMMQFEALGADLARRLAR